MIFVALEQSFVFLVLEYKKCEYYVLVRYVCYKDNIQLYILMLIVFISGRNTLYINYYLKKV